MVKGYGKGKFKSDAQRRAVFSNLNKPKTKKRKEGKLESFSQKRKTKKYNPKKRWVSTGGWRGYNQSAYAVAGSSDTGLQRGSPCPSDEVNIELKDFQKYLGNKGIKTNIRTTESSNAFMRKKWVVVDNPDDFVKAKELTKKYLKKKELETQFIHESD